MRSVVLIALTGLAAPAAAEVKSASAAGFEVENKVAVPTPPNQTFAALGRIGAWWNPSHSYSGKADNLSLELRAGGCFCERLEGGGGVEHMRVVYAEPGKMLRLQGGLGPLQAEGAAGTLSFELKPADGGTELTMRYVVGGYVRGGADRLAAPVDAVLREQLTRLQAHLAGQRTKRRD